VVKVRQIGPWDVKKGGNVPQATKLLAEELLVAILNRLEVVGQDKLNQTVLAQHFNRAAESWGGIWNDFKTHPTGSSGLGSTISNLVMGGSLVRKFGTEILVSTAHTRGPYGLRLYAEIPEPLRSQVDQFVGWVDPL
jgi:hypothetical protein